MHDAAPAAAQCPVERSDEFYAQVGEAYRKYIVE